MDNVADVDVDFDWNVVVVFDFRIGDLGVLFVYSSCWRGIELCFGHWIYFGCVFSQCDDVFFGRAACGACLVSEIDCGGRYSGIGGLLASADEFDRDGNAWPWRRRKRLRVRDDANGSGEWRDDEDFPGDGRVE